MKNAKHCPKPERCRPAVQADAVTAEALVQAGQGLQESGLPGPVQTDEPHHLMGPQLEGLPDADRLVRGFHFEDYTGTLLKDLSTGNKKKAFLITAFALKPELLLLDEPVNGRAQRTLPKISAQLQRPNAQTTASSPAVLVSRV